jgi:hypothetical protein
VKGEALALGDLMLSSHFTPHFSLFTPFITHSSLSEAPC